MEKVLNENNNYYTIVIDKLGDRLKNLASISTSEKQNQKQSSLVCSFFMQKLQVTVMNSDCFSVLPKF